MTDEPDLTEDQVRVMEALGKALMEGNPGFTDKDVAERLGMTLDEVKCHLQALADLGFILHAFRNTSTGEVRPMPPCRRCGKASDGLDHLCTQCRAITSVDRLVDNLTNALENFLDDRWSPHEWGQPRPAFYYDRPNFDGDETPYMQQIGVAQAQLAAAATRLAQLAMPPGVKAKAVAAYEPYWFNEGTPHGGGPPEEYNGIHAALDWGFAEASSTEPITCKRMAKFWLKDMVTSGELLLPGDPLPDNVLPPGDPRPGRGVHRITDTGLQVLIEMPPED
jgi:hypothetical protein